MSDDEITYGDDTDSPAAGRRRRGGITGMVLAELRELAGSLGVDPTGLRRGDLIHEIREAQGGLVSRSRVVFNASNERLTHVERIHHDDGRIEERVTTITDDVATSTDDADVQVVEIEPIDLTGDGGGPVGEGPRTAGPPPPARLLSLASLLLAPGERENWLGELRGLTAETGVERREPLTFEQADQPAGSSPAPRPAQMASHSGSVSRPSSTRGNAAK